MASVKTIYDDDGNARGFKVRYRTGEGAARSKTFPPTQRGQRLAGQFAARVEVNKLSGSELDDRGALLSVADYKKEWQAVQLHAPGTVLKVDAALAPFVDSVGPNTKLGRVRQSHVRAWVKARAAEVAPGTVRVELGWVRGMFKAAVADRLIGFNPCDGVTIEPGPRRQMVIPDVAGVAAIAARLPARWSFVGPLGARSGLRPGELLGLCADQVDWLGLEVRVDRQLVRGQVVAEPKTSASRRTVPLDAETVQLLAAHVAAFPLGEPVAVVERDGSVVGEGQVIFHRPDGRPLTHRSVNDTWARQAAGAKLAGVRLHDMRHFYATELLAAGLSIAEVAALLGHADPSVTARVYAHAPADAAERARTATAGVFSPRPGRVLAP